LRKELPEIGWGDCTVVDAGATEVLALRHEWDGRALLTMHNLAPRAATARVDAGEAGHLDDLHQPGAPVRPRRGGFRVHLPAYGQRWFRVRQG
jgi:maltose alpha-D-glucosyltransferase/alpha-amylase